MKKMVTILFLILSVGCFAYINLLIDEDWLYLENDNKTPAITLPDSNEEHYNEWSCYPTQDLIQKKKMGSPTIVVENDKGTIEYAFDPGPMVFSKIIINGNS